MTEENNQDKEINDSQKSTTNNEETPEGITKDSNLLGLAFNFIIKLLKSENLKDPKTIVLIIALTYGTLITTLYMGKSISSSSNEPKNREEQQVQKESNYKDAEEIKMNRACNVLKDKSPAFQEKIKGELEIKDLDKLEIKAILRDKKDYNYDIWKVFLWVCETEVSDGNNNTYKNLFGIALDEYCSGLSGFEPKAKVVPFYKDYSDPYSWYCVRIPGDYLDEHQ